MGRDIVPELDRQKLIAGFNAAAKGYKTVSVLQDKVGGGLLERLELMRIAPERVLDLGSGPGNLAHRLKQHYRHAGIVQMDIAENMLRISRGSSTRIFSRQAYVCADAENIPLANKSVDMVFSNLMLQWSRDPDRLFEEVLRILRPGGLFLFSTLGPDTLRELRDSWAVADTRSHVNTFMDMHDLGDGLVRTGFADPVMEVDILTLMYGDVGGLMSDLKGLGAHYVGTARRRSLTGKNRFMLMQHEYEKKRSHNGLPATYEVIYGHGWAPTGESGNRKSEDGSFTISLESLKQSLRGRS